MGRNKYSTWGEGRDGGELRAEGWVMDPGRGGRNGEGRGGMCVILGGENKSRAISCNRGDGGREGGGKER